jgi:hypothetical protein
MVNDNLFINSGEESEQSKRTFQSTAHTSGLATQALPLPLTAARSAPLPVTHPTRSHTTVRERPVIFQGVCPADICCSALARAPPSLPRRHSVVTCAIFRQSLACHVRYHIAVDARGLLSPTVVQFYYMHHTVRRTVNAYHWRRSTTFIP